MYSQLNYWLQCTALIRLWYSSDCNARTHLLCLRMSLRFLLIVLHSCSRGGSASPPSCPRPEPGQDVPASMPGQRRLRGGQTHWQLSPQVTSWPATASRSLSADLFWWNFISTGDMTNMKGPVASELIQLKWEVPFYQSNFPLLALEY